jgi:retron-type reverse transcriptase
MRNIPQFEDIFSYKALLESYFEFRKGKRNKSDVAEFSMKLSENLIALSEDILGGKYIHGGYERFVVNDPKRRDIHKASVRDRIVHRAIYRALYLHFENSFIFDSYSSRNGFGTHRALDRYRVFSRKVTKNYKKTGWVLKLDIRKFFASVNQDILLSILSRKIKFKKTFSIVSMVIRSFNTPGKQNTGMPLGNLTSQLFSNIYLNEFDQFVKREQKAKFYVRYADDFVIISRDRKQLCKYLFEIYKFLIEKLQLYIHRDKIILNTISSGIDFLGWINFPYHRIPRTKTKRKFIKASKNFVLNSSSKESYKGLFLHGNTHNLITKYI